MSHSIEFRHSGYYGIAMVRSTLEIILGILLLVLGVAGWLLPIVPGWLFMIPGLALLSRHFRWARRLWAYLRAVRANWARRKLRGRLPVNPPS